MRMTERADVLSILIDHIPPGVLIKYRSGELPVYQLYEVRPLSRGIRPGCLTWTQRRRS